MLHGLLADGVLGLHFGFLLFAVCGGLLVLRWPRLAWLHVPALLWGATVSLMGWVCPLTPLENHFRRLAGEAGYTGTFLERYVAPLVYPGALTRELQLAAGIFLLVSNLALYGLLLRRRLRTARREDKDVK
ncbi:MAG: DUF2784 domain-containing protein [Acidobacteriota bacterium]|nr:DUF2784 domain-containing protein [Acidobacteriota bacterium]MDH3524368.1 DUF2784 domain-containing protein [Acidobacteriota bacterium]